MHVIGQTKKKLRTRSNRSDCFLGDIQFSRYTWFGHKTYSLRERLELELNRKTGKQFSRVRLGFFANKKTDIRLVVARGSSLKISTKFHGNVFFFG